MEKDFEETERHPFDCVLILFTFEGCKLLHQKWRRAVSVARKVREACKIRSQSQTAGQVGRAKKQGAVENTLPKLSAYHNWDQQGCVRFKLWYFQQISFEGLFSILLLGALSGRKQDRRSFSRWKLIRFWGGNVSLKEQGPTQYNQRKGEQEWHL